MIIDENYETNPLFQTNYVNLDWMKDEDWVIRLETRKYLEKEIRYNKNLRMIARDLTRLNEGKIKNSKFLINHLFLEEFEKVVKSNLNILIHVAGKTGSGKSLLAQKLAFLLIDIYKKYSEENPDHTKDYSKASVYVEFTVEAANNRLKYMKPGDILIRDEQSKTSGEGSRIENDKNENLRKAIRGNNINFFDCQPGIEVSPTLNFVIMTLGYNTKSKITVAIVFVPMSGNRMDQTILHPIGYISLKLHNNKLFLKDYDRRKQEYNDFLQSAGGEESTSLKKELIINDGKALIKYIKENTETPETTGEYDLLYAFAGIPTRSTHHPKRVINYVKMKLRKSNKSSVKVDDKIDYDEIFQSTDGENDDPFLNFYFNEDAALETFQSSDKSRDLRVYLNSKSGMRNTDQAIDEKISHTRIGQIIKEVEGWIDYLSGHAFEKFTAKIYSDLGYEILTDLGKTAIKGDPDLIVKKDGIIEILSLKVSRSMKKTVTPYRGPEEKKRGDCMPEINEFLRRKSKGENVKLYLEFINLITEDHRKIELNEKNYKKIKSIPLY